jgi:hypothetical protein
MKTLVPLLMPLPPSYKGRMKASRVPYLSKIAFIKLPAKFGREPPKIFLGPGSSCRAKVRRLFSIEPIRRLPVRGKGEAHPR